MLRLEQVSKIYSAHGVISTGFNKVSLEFDKGEFIAITGESGSGKSTLLNVISGLDSYEEGEMYIMGKPTSGFSQEELEEYRKEYIGNIFQSFNLVNSYTVYQNVELVLLMSGYDRDEIKPRVKEILLRCGLSEYENKKASKLSGGQKQRVAIARALAKETPVIVADEPTGNLDVKSAEEIMKLLYEISEDRLVIIVTHNYEQVEPYVTRKIEMHDGTVVEDKNLRKVRSEKEIHLKKARADQISKGNLLRLGVRNTFNIPSKFFLLLIVFMFLWTGVAASYTSSGNMLKVVENEGYNQFFNDISPERLVITKKDKSPFKEKDYKKISAIPNVSEIVRQDMLTDSSLSLHNSSVSEDENDMFFSIKLNDIKGGNFKIAEGRMPEKNNEAVVLINKDEEPYIKNMAEELLKTEVKIYDDKTGTGLSDKSLKVTGYGFTDEEISAPGMWIDGLLYTSDSVISDVNNRILENYCTNSVEFAGKLIKLSDMENSYYLSPSDKVGKGTVYIPEDIAMYEEGDPVGKNISITNESIYFKDSSDFKTGAVYTSENCESLLGDKHYENLSGGIYLNTDDYRKMFDKGNYQSGVYIENTGLKDATEEKLREEGFDVLSVSDAKQSFGTGTDIISKIIYTLAMIVTLVILFFVCYFIIKLIMKSGNSYYSVIRMLGAAKKNCSFLLKTELFIVYNIAFAVGLAVTGLIKSGIIGNEYLLNLADFLTVSDIVILYVVMGIMSLMLAGRYAAKLFKPAAMDAYREEV